MHRLYSSSCVSSCMPSSVMYSGMYYCTCLTSPGTDYWNFDYKKMYKTGTIFERHLLAAMDRCIAVLHATLAHFQTHDSCPQDKPTRLLEAGVT